MFATAAALIALGSCVSVLPTSHEAVFLGTQGSDKVFQCVYHNIFNRQIDVETLAHVPETSEYKRHSRSLCDTRGLIEKFTVQHAA